MITYSLDPCLEITRPAIIDDEYNKYFLTLAPVVPQSTGFIHVPDRPSERNTSQSEKLGRRTPCVRRIVGSNVGIAPPHHVHVSRTAQSLLVDTLYFCRQGCHYQAGKRASSIDELFRISDNLMLPCRGSAHIFHRQLGSRRDECQTSSTRRLSRPPTAVINAISVIAPMNDTIT